ncbi:MAG: terminase family protein [Candidatus Peribacteraceae bacterium]|nr:terminase family protein [Candidatus Peribacteraceae bacterium]
MEISKDLLKSDIDYFNRKLTPDFRLRKDQLSVVKAFGIKNILCAGRRYGKTAIISDHALWKAITIPNNRIGIFAPGWDELEIVFEMIDDIKRNTVLENSVKRGKDLKFRKEFTNGTKIIGRVGSKLSRGKRGRGFDYTYFTEAAFIPEDCMTAIRPSRLDSKTAFELQESTPIGNNHFKKTWDNPHYVKIRRKTIDNPNVNREQLLEDKETMSEWEYEQEYNANFLDDALRAFPQVLMDLAFNGNLREEYVKKDGYRYIGGMDLARKRDKSIIKIGRHKLNEKKITVVRTIEIKIPPNDPYFWKKTIKEANELIKLYGVDTFCIDQTGIGDMPTMELQNLVQEENTPCKVDGINFTYANKNLLGGIMNSLQMYFEKEDLNMPMDTELERQLSTIRYETHDTTQIFTHKGKSPDRVSALSLMIKAAGEITHFHAVKSKGHSMGNPKEGILDRSVGLSQKLDTETQRSFYDLI